MNLVALSKWMISPYWHSTNDWRRFLLKLIFMLAYWSLLKLIGGVTFWGKDWTTLGVPFRVLTLPKDRTLKKGLSGHFGGLGFRGHYDREDN
jgi:hypothetical protein